MHKFRKRINRIIGPPVIRILHIKLFGKNIFMNRYTRKVPGLRRLIRRVDSLTLLVYTREQIQKEYKVWFSKNFPDKKKLASQQEEQRLFKERPLISIVVPTYNTDIRLLKECFDSVLSQTYDNWQLCIADDASTNSEIRQVIKNYASKDGRIKYIFRDKNGHICNASNSALGLAEGEYIALLDHDDYLWPNALFEVVKVINANPKADFIYTDEDKIDEASKVHSEPFFRPDWSPEFLRSINYITHFAVIKRKLVNEVGNFRAGYEGAQDWDLFLRVSRKTNEIYHVPTILYSWRKTSNSTSQAPSAKDYAYINQEKALEDDIKARGLSAKISWQIQFSMWRVSYAIKGNPLVSIVIPTKNQPEYIERCLKSIEEKTDYKNFEVVIVDTGSDEKAVWGIYERYKHLGKGTRVVKWEKQPFNFASACDFGAEKSKGEYLLFLNNDTEVITSDWVTELLAYAQQPDIGAVGCKLFYPDRRIQHAGIILGVGGQNGTPGIAGHYFPAYIDTPPQSPMQDLYVGGTRNFTAVTAACVMVSMKKFNAVKGFDPIFRIAFNDVDLCLKLHKKGWRNVYLPHVNLFHYESISVGQPGSKQRDLGVFAKEIELMLNKWKPLIDNDPFYHPEFRRDIANARLKEE